jgi:hypothetical protein
MTMELLEMRLRSLERRNARLKTAVMLVAVLAVGANILSVSGNLWADLPEPFWADAPQQQMVQDTVKAHRIEVVDTDGKVLAVLGKLTDRLNRTSTGLALVSNDRQVVRLTLDSDSDGSLNHATLTVSDPKDAEQKELFRAGVTSASEGIGLFPGLLFEYRDYFTRMEPDGLRIAVKTEQDTPYADVISVRANEDGSAMLSLGGLFKPFKIRAIAEADKPRLELEKGEGKKRKMKTYGLAP